MKFFAMIDGQQRGPMSLDDLVGEGVRPDTYVWTKGMDDWAHASEVPDICRYFRQRLAGTLPSQKYSARQAETRQAEADMREQEELLSQLPPMARNIVRKSGVRLTKDMIPAKTTRPSSTLPIILYLLCLILIVVGFMLR